MRFLNIQQHWSHSQIFLGAYKHLLPTSISKIRIFISIFDSSNFLKCFNLPPRGICFDEFSLNSIWLTDASSLFELDMFFLICSDTRGMPYFNSYLLSPVVFFFGTLNPETSAPCLDPCLEEDKSKTAFVTFKGLSQFKVLPVRLRPFNVLWRQYLRVFSGKWA